MWHTRLNPDPNFRVFDVLQTMVIQNESVNHRAKSSSSISLKTSLFEISQSAEIRDSLSPCQDIKKFSVQPFLIKTQASSRDDEMACALFYFTLRYVKSDSIYLCRFRMH
jgi:hypothetical protein